MGTLPMASIRMIEGFFEELETPEDSKWHMRTLVPNRVYLSRGFEGEHTIFVEGAGNSFGPLRPLSGIEHRDDAIDVETGCYRRW